MRNFDLQNLKLVFETILYNRYEMKISKNYNIDELIDNFIVDTIIYLIKRGKYEGINEPVRVIDIDNNRYIGIKVNINKLLSSYGTNTSSAIKIVVYSDIDTCDYKSYIYIPGHAYRDKENICKMTNSNNNNANIKYFYYALIMSIIDYSTIINMAIKTKYIEVKADTFAINYNDLYYRIAGALSQPTKICDGFAKVKMQKYEDNTINGNSTTAIVPIIYENGKAISLDIEITQSILNLSYENNGNFNIYKDCSSICLIDFVDNINDTYLHNISIDTRENTMQIKIYYDYKDNIWRDALDPNKVYKGTILNN